MVTTSTAPAPAFEITPEHYAAAVRMARRFAARAGWQNYERIYDAAIDGLMRAARKFDPTLGSPFGALARTTIISEMRVSLKRKHYRRTGERRPLSVPLHEYTATTLPPPDAEHDRPDPTLVADLLTVLTPAESEVMRLKLAGLDYSEIGRERGTSKQASQQLYSRSVAKLHDEAARRRAESAGVSDPSRRSGGEKQEN